MTRHPVLLDLDGTRRRAPIGGLALLVASACSITVVHPVQRDELERRPTEAAILAACNGGGGNEVRLAQDTEPDAPILVLEEIRLHGNQPPQPTLAVWSDGRVLFEHESLYGSISWAEARALAREVAVELSAVPRAADAQHPYLITGGQLTRITVRDGDRWISASVYGAYKEHFLAAAGGIPPEIEPRASASVASEDERDTSRYMPEIETSPPPRSRARTSVYWTCDPMEAFLSSRGTSTSHSCRRSRSTSERAWPS